MFFIAFAPSPALITIGVTILAFGSGYDLTVRSLITSLVHQNHYATLYAVIALVTWFGILISGPLFAATFAKGLELGGMWMSLPFMMTGGLYTLALGLICFVRLPKVLEDREEGEEEELLRED